MRCFEILKRNVNTRRETGAGRSITGNFLERSGDGEFEIANFDLVASSSAKLEEQTFIHNGAIFFAEFARGDRWRCFHRSIKRKVTAESAETNEPCSHCSPENRPWW